MDNLLKRGRVIAERQAGALVDALAEAAVAELTPDLEVEKAADGIVLRGRDLLRRLAFDGRLRGLALVALGLAGMLRGRR